MCYSDRERATPNKFTGFKNTILNICLVSSVNDAADVINKAEQKQAGNHFRVRGGSVH